MESLEKRLKDYKSIKGFIKEVDDGYGINESQGCDGGFGSNSSITSKVRKLMDNSGVEHFTSFVTIKSSIISHNYDSNYICHNLDDTMKEAYINLLKYARKRMHIDDGYIIMNGNCKYSDSSIRFNYAGLFETSDRETKMNFYRHKREMKKHPELREKNINYELSRRSKASEMLGQRE